MKYIVILFLLIFFGSFQGCSGFGSVKKTNELKPGMTTAEVKNLFGEPKQTEFIANKLIWKYSLHQPWVGYIPYYLVFDKDTMMLEEWFANEEEYYRNQQLWLQAFPPKQKHEIEIQQQPPSYCCS